MGYLCFILPASFLYLFLMLARRGCMVRRHLVFGLVALAHGVTADLALQLPSPPPPASHGGRQLSAPACRSTPNASNSSWSSGLMVECTESVVDWSNASNRSHLSNASNASSPYVLQPPAPSAPPHPPCGCQHISVTSAESVQSNRMGIYTRTNDFVGARQLYQRGSPASLQYLYYDTRCACSTPPHARVTRSAHTQHRPPAQTPAHTCRIYSHGRSRLPLLPQPGLVDPRKDRRARWSRRTNEHGRLPTRGEWHLDRVEWQHLQQRLRPPGGVLEVHGLRVRALPRVRR